MKARIIALLAYSCVSCGIAVAQPRVYSLKECRDLAVKNNIKARTSAYSIESARHQQKSAFMKYLPTVTGTALGFLAADDMLRGNFELSDGDRQTISTAFTAAGLNPAVVAGLPASYKYGFVDKGYMLGITAMEPLYAGGQITTGNRLAKLQTEVSTLQQQTTDDELIQNVDQQYYQLLTLYATRSTFQEAQAQLASIYRDAKAAVDAGLTNGNDALQVQIKQNEVDDQLHQVDNGIRLAQMALAQYMGLGIEGQVVMTDTTAVVSQPADPATLLLAPAEAIEQLRQSQLLDKAVEAAHLQTKMERGKSLPTLAVGGSYSYSKFLENGQGNLVGFATLSIPISQLWSGGHDIKRKQIAEQQARDEREDNRQLLMLHMQQCYNELDNAYNSVMLAQKSVEQAKENLRLNRNYYAAGTCSMSDLLDAQTTHQKAQTSYVSAVGNYYIARTNYLVATGRNVE